MPSVVGVNGDRSNLRYGMATSASAYQYGQCSAKVDFEADVFQPPTSAATYVARSYWYMRDEYGIRISRQQQQLFEAWAKQDPVEAWERERNRRFAAIQGHGNHMSAARQLPLNQSQLIERQPTTRAYRVATVISAALPTRPVAHDVM